MTELKLNHRVPQSVDRLNAYQTAVEDELHKRLILVGVPGVVSADGTDIDHDNAPCALKINVNDATAIDVVGGTVVFAIGEFVDVATTDLQAISISAAVTDSQVVRLEYGEVDDGQAEANPYTNFATKPKTRKKTPKEMLVIETVTAFNAQSADVKSKSVVLGVVKYVGTTLTVDNSRDTFTFSRPWYSPVDVTHRSYVGSGAFSVTNPHKTSANDLSVGDFSMWQAMQGGPSCVLARPTGFGRLPGSLCSEVIPAGNFLNDATGLITGKAGASYAYLGFWPDRLLLARLNVGSTEVSAWIPHGRNVVAVFDPQVFTVAADLQVFYTKVTAGSLPASLLGATTVTMSDPADNEILVAGGNFFKTLNEKNAIFTDVGLVPMAFDILVDAAGKVYKSPEVLYCNTKLDTIGAAPVPFTVQPRVATRLRVAISNYNPGFTEVRFQLTGKNEAGTAVSEQIVFTGPLAAAGISYTENTFQRQFTLNEFTDVTQLQVLVRNNDGPNTTVTVFAEYSPLQASQVDDLLLASVHWSGGDVTANYANGPFMAFDRRLVTRGGGTKGTSALGSIMNQPGLVEAVLGGAPSGSTTWATMVEDFNDPTWMMYPQADIATTTDKPIELPDNSIGARFGYQSRKMPFAATITLPIGAEALYLRMLPAPQVRFPAPIGAFQVLLTLYRVGGSNVVLTGTLTQPYAPFQVVFTGGPVPSGSYYAASVTVPRLSDAGEVFQGFLLHVRA